LCDFARPGAIEAHAQADPARASSQQHQGEKRRRHSTEHVGQPVQKVEQRVAGMRAGDRYRGRIGDAALDGDLGPNQVEQRIDARHPERNTEDAEDFQAMPFARGRNGLSRNGLSRNGLSRGLRLGTRRYRLGPH
jgi:hypothetical protein